MNKEKSLKESTTYKLLKELNDSILTTVLLKEETLKEQYHYNLFLSGMTSKVILSNSMSEEMKSEIDRKARNKLIKDYLKHSTSKLIDLNLIDWKE